MRRAASLSAYAVPFVVCGAQMGVRGGRCLGAQCDSINRDAACRVVIFPSRLAPMGPPVFIFITTRRTASLSGLRRAKIPRLPTPSPPRAYRPRPLQAPHRTHSSISCTPPTESCTRQSRGSGTASSRSGSSTKSPVFSEKHPDTAARLTGICPIAWRRGRSSNVPPPSPPRFDSVLAPTRRCRGWRGSKGGLFSVRHSPSTV